MSSPTPHSPKDLVELTPVFREGENEQGKVAKVYDSELCMLALPPDEQQLLSRVSQYLFYRGIIPVVVRSPTEAIIHSRHSRFVVIILPDNDPVLIRNIRSVDGMNYGTPVIAISTADILPESTLHMLGTNVIQEAIHRTTNSERLEADLISALNRAIGQSCYSGIDPRLSMLPLPVQTTWSTFPHYTSAPMPSPPFHIAGPAMAHSQCATNSVPIEIPRKPCPCQVQGVNVVSSADGSQIHGSHQLQEGAMEQNANLFVGEPVTEVISQGLSAPVKVSPSLCTNAQENFESVLPGIETLLNAIQVVEGQEGEASRNSQATSTFTKFMALNSPDSDNTRGSSGKRPKRARRSSGAGRSKSSAKAATSETDLESLNDTKSPISVSLAGKKPYFLELDSYREALADDPNASAVDRHNSKERHRRIRITKAAEFFKAVIPRMDPNMDKATAFQMTVYYMVFLRNALLKQDPPILPKLHQTFIEEWGEVFNLEDRTEADEK